MKPIKGVPSTSQDDYQLNIINIARHGVRNFSRQEIACQSSHGMFRYTYRDALRRMNQLAGALTELGVSIGDRIGVLDWNSHRNYEMYFAIPGSGAVMLLLNLRLSPPDLSYVIDHAEAYLKITDRVKDVIKSGGEWISQLLAHKFAKWQLPDEILFVDAIPKTSVGKINKKVIRDVHRDRYMRSTG